MAGERQDRTAAGGGDPSDAAALVALMPFAVASGVEVVRAEPGEVAGRMAWTQERCTAGGVLHGGAVMTLADSVGAICAFLNLPGGAAGTTTIASSTSFFRGVRAGVLHATARPLHVGRTTVVVGTDLVDDDGRAVASVTQTQAVLRG